MLRMLYVLPLSDYSRITLFLRKKWGLAKYLLTLCDYTFSMNSIRNIAMVVIALGVMLVGVGCNNDTDMALTSQQTNIERYLTGSHQPRLIVEDDVPNSLDEEPQFYTRWGMDIYRYISTYYAEGRELKPEVVNGSKIEIVYTAYIFKNGAPSVNDMFATNDEVSLEKLRAAGLDTEYEWTTDPYAITIGHSDVVSGLETALKGCREGDSLEVYLTFKTSYGDNYIGKVPSKSSVVWFVNIISVK